MTHTYFVFGCRNIFMPMNCPSFPTECEFPLLPIYKYHIGLDYDPLLMGDDDMCNCHGVSQEGCIEGEGDCDNDDQCMEVTRDMYSIQTCPVACGRAHLTLETSNFFRVSDADITTAGSWSPGCIRGRGRSTWTVRSSIKTEYYSSWFIRSRLQKRGLGDF